jgi:hypothetical protein
MSRIKAPAYRAEYERIYGAPVTFEAEWNAVLLDEKWMTTRSPCSRAMSSESSSEHADALLKSLENSKTTRGRVESLLMPILHKGEANMDAIAGEDGAQPADAVPPAESGCESGACEREYPSR